MISLHPLRSSITFTITSEHNLENLKGYWGSLHLYEATLGSTKVAFLKTSFLDDDFISMKLLILADFQFDSCQIFIFYQVSYYVCVKQMMYSFKRRPAKI